MFTGIDRRMGRFFAQDGKSLCLAFDHGMVGMNTDGMATPEKTLRECIAAGADSILTSIGLALEFGHLMKHTGLALNLDDYYADPSPLVDQALAVGAEFGKLIVYTGPEGDPETIHKGHLLSAICRERNLPLMIEPIPGSFENKAQHTPLNIGIAGRIAAEVGADVVKLQYSGDTESFAKIMAPIYKPVIVLGGPNRGDIRAVLTDVHGAMACGAVGIAMGRNIWAHQTPAKVIAAMNVIIHGNGTVEEAMRELQ
jgi:DhnA family fructose-bisphosphate aldolase class Ia